MKENIENIKGKHRKSLFWFKLTELIESLLPINSWKPMFLCWLEWQGLWRGENIRHCGEGDGGKVRDQWWSCGISQDCQRLWHGHDRSKRWVKSFVLKERFINTKATSNGIKKEWTFKEHSKMILSSIMKHWFEFIEIKNSSIEWCMNHDLSNPMFSIPGCL